MDCNYEKAQGCLRVLANNPPTPDTTELDLLCDIRYALIALSHAVLSTSDAMPIILS
jgi:hypothetical protein